MTPDPSAGRPRAAAGFKSRSGLARIPRATVHALAGVRAAFRHEAAFRQELAVGVPLIALAWWLDVGRWQALAMSAVIAAIWAVELLNSAVEALADRVTLEPDPLVARAKDIGSAAVMTSILIAAAVWGVALWP